MSRAPESFFSVFSGNSEFRREWRGEIQPRAGGSKSAGGQTYGFEVVEVPFFKLRMNSVHVAHAQRTGAAVHEPEIPSPGMAEVRIVAGAIVPADHRRRAQVRRPPGFAEAVAHQPGVGGAFIPFADFQKIAVQNLAFIARLTLDIPVEAVGVTCACIIGEDRPVSLSRAEKYFTYRKIFSVAKRVGPVVRAVSHCGMHDAVVIIRIHVA